MRYLNKHMAIISEKATQSCATMEIDKQTHIYYRIKIITITLYIIFSLNNIYSFILKNKEHARDILKHRSEGRSYLKLISSTVHAISDILNCNHTNKF